MYKMVAIDMDGTLLRTDRTISERTKKTIEKAIAKGVKIVLASGRPMDGIEKYLQELNLVSEEDYVIGFNGALVQNIKTREIIKTNVLNGKDLSYLYNLSKEIGVNVHAFTQKGCITPKMSKYSKQEGTMNGIPVDVIDFNHIAEDEEIIKFMMVDEPEVLSQAITELPSEVYDRYTVVQSTPYFLEFLNKKANKGEAVKALAEHLNISSKEIMCIGDAGNDAHMIEYAGLGVAMGNAFEEIKEMADYITHSNEEDGVARAIEKFIVA